MTCLCSPDIIRIYMPIECNYSEDFRIATCSGGLTATIEATSSPQLIQAQGESARSFIFIGAIVIFLLCVLIALNTFKR